MSWTSIEQVARMAAEVIYELPDDESPVLVQFRRVVTPNPNGPRWTVSVGNYSSKACTSPEHALEEVAGMYRGALLSRIERAEERLARTRAALPSDPIPKDGD